MHETWSAAPGGARVERVAILSMHTCPLDQPGVGDSGGMNVVIRSVSRRLAEMGLHVDVFTRRAGDEPEVDEMDPGVRVIHLEAGPARPIEKEELPSALSEFLCSMLRFEVEQAAAGGVEGRYYDAIHSHYWLSGWVARLARERWNVPWLHSSHTLGKVKNEALTEGDSPEPAMRLASEERVLQSADCVLAPTVGEAAELVNLYGVSPERVRVVSPGVESSVFTVGDRAKAKADVGIGPRPMILFVGRLQPLKAPDVAIRALGTLMARKPHLDCQLVLVGGPSGRMGVSAEGLMDLAARLGIGDRVRLQAPVPHEMLRDYYRAADAVIVPSRTESFGLVALEASSCGAPVVASDAGGLRTAVRDGVTGLLVPPGDADRFADALSMVLEDSALGRTLGAAGARFARRFDWRQAAAGLLAVYEETADRLASATSAPPA